MKIAIIGGGIAGVTAAWTLDPRHQVTLFEQAELLGGHAQTFCIRHQGTEITVDPGAQHLSARGYPQVFKLLRKLQVRQVPLPVSVTIHSQRTRRSFVLTPSFNARGLLALLRPQQLSHLGQFWRVLRAAERLERLGDWSQTVEEFLARLKLPANFRAEVLDPFLAGLYDLTYSTMGTISARSMMWYPVHQQPETPFKPFAISVIEGGINSFIYKIVEQLKQTQVRTRTRIRALRRSPDGFTLLEADGASQPFDAVVLALPAYEAAKLCDGEAALGAVQEVLNRFPFHATKVAIHADASFMPAERRQWSTCNYLDLGHAGAITIWIGRTRGIDLFKTWITHSPAVPRDVYLQKDFYHPTMTPRYYQAQKELAAQQGRDNLWFVGSYTQSIDSQESGLVSGLEVGRRLAPDSPNQLSERDGGDVA